MTQKKSKHNKTLLTLSVFPPDQNDLDTHFIITTSQLVCTKLQAGREGKKALRLLHPDVCFGDVDLEGTGGRWCCTCKEGRFLHLFLVKRLSFTQMERRSVRVPAGFLTPFKITHLSDPVF